MPSRADCDHVVRTPTQFVNSVQKDNVSIYLDQTIDLSDHVAANGGIEMGSGVIIVGGFCDPAIDGRGPEIVCETNGHRMLTSCYGEAPSLWGVSMRGPELGRTDPDHTASDFASKQSTGLHCYDDNGVLKVVGCEMRGWTLAGMEIGAKNHETTAEVRRTSYHHNRMNHLGYGVQHYSGDLSMDRCFINYCRHGIAGFGYPTCSWELANSVVGPDGYGHSLDMHKLSNNIDSEEVLEQFEHGGDTAGGNVQIRRCSLMQTWDLRGFDQEAFAGRGVPVGKYRIEKTHFWHENKPTKANVQGNAYRQEWDDWKNFYVEDNVFGASNLKDGVGAPRAKKANEDDDEPEQEDPSGQPSEPNQPTMKRLKVRGHGGTGVNGDYSIVVHGSIEAQEGTEPSEQIEDLGNNRKRINGNMWGGTDVFLLADDAMPVRAELQTPCTIWLDEVNVTGALVGPAMVRRVDKHQGQLNHLQAQLDKLRLWASELGSTLSFTGEGDSE